MKVVAAILSAAVALVALQPVSPAEAKRGPVLKGKSYYYYSRRPGYRKLRKSDIYASRKFIYPWLGARTQGAPFDNGFFYETPVGPYGGTTPYMH